MQLISKETKQIGHDLKEVFCLITKGHKKLILWAGGLLTIAATLKLMEPVIAAVIISKIQGNLGIQTLTGIMIFWIILAGFLSNFVGFSELIFWDSMEPLRLFYRNRLFEQNFKKLLDTPPILLENQQSSKIVSLLNSLNQSLSEIFMYFMRVFVRMISWIGAIIILAKAKPSFAIITFVCWIGAYLTNTKIIKHFSQAHEIEKKRIQYDAEETDHMDNMVNINTLQIQDEITQDISHKLDEWAKFFFCSKMKEDAAQILLLLWNVFPIISTALIAANTALQTGNVSQFVLLTGLVGTMVNTGSGILFFSGCVVANLKVYHKLKEELQYDHTLDLKLGKEMFPSGGTIEMQNVSFTYPDAKKPVLNGLSLKIKQGDRVAIIGNSGMGKSTLINVMQHAYEIQKGQVLINGKDVRHISLKSLKKNITYINQHPIFWRQKSIKENLLMFNPKATDVELYQALQSANLLNEISQKEKGIESKVTALSAGQKQRLSLARAFLRQAPIIIMDEPTANLDTQAQTKVLEGIKNLSISKQKPTVIFASNVPAEIASANRILLLENGQIVEDGKPKNLMNDENSKTYKRLKKYKALFEN